MSNNLMFKKLKRQNGEKFAQTLRNFHNGLLEIPNIDKIVRHAGRDAEPLLPYLMSLLIANDIVAIPSPIDPFLLLEQAGYDAFHADTLEKQNSIREYFEADEILCTFNDASRYKNYHIVHAVRKDAADIKRAAKGEEKRQDEYGTSVISIQMLKTGGFISIKNRYNDTVVAADHTFGSNPDEIAKGLSDALKHHFNVDFSAEQSTLPNGYVLMSGQIFKYNYEDNNIYYGNQAWAVEGCVHTVDRAAGDALFDGFMFDNKTKKLKRIDLESKDKFHWDFNGDYGGNRSLCVQDGNLMLDGVVLIGAEKSKITSLFLPKLKTMGNDSLNKARTLVRFEATALTSMGDDCLKHSPVLTDFIAPALTEMGDDCLYSPDRLTNFHVPALKGMGDNCLFRTTALMHFYAPALEWMLDKCLHTNLTLMNFEAPMLISMGDSCLKDARLLTQVDVRSLTMMSTDCFRTVSTLKEIEAPNLLRMGQRCFDNTDALKKFEAPRLQTMGEQCFYNASALKQLDLPALTRMENQCLKRASKLTHFHAPALEKMEYQCLHFVPSLVRFSAPSLTYIGRNCVVDCPDLMHFEAPALKEMGEHCLERAFVLMRIDAPKISLSETPWLTFVPAYQQFMHQGSKHPQTQYTPG